VTDTLTIDHIGQRGDGVASGRTHGLIGDIFVPFSLPGEKVVTEPVPGHPDRAHLVRVATASAERIEAICPHFGICGGCALQHWQTSSYRAWKRQLVVTALAQAGIEAPVDELIDAHGAGRRRAVLHARRGTHDILEVGFAAPRAHQIIGIDRCPVLAPSMYGTIPAAWAIAEALGNVRKPLDIQVTASDVGLDVDVRGSGSLSTAVSGALARLAAPHRLARITRHGDIVVQRTPPQLQVGRAQVQLPPGAFLQATAEGEAVLARLVLEHVGSAKSVADLFCGVGPFALRLAERARVMAADSEAGAVAALTKAAAGTQGLKPILAETRDLFRRPFIGKELSRLDAIVFDPPRQGAQAQVQEIALSGVKRVVAVSCNPATFARDAAILIAAGYRLTRVTPVDQFRYSAHVEVIAGFSR
jgi:23S rRNA (uracil1939-C5)-methyltransferase